MDTTAAVDLFSPPFWCAVALACLVMVPLAGGSARRVAFALINLGFIGYYRRSDLAAVLVGLLVAYALLQMVQRRRFTAAWLTLGGAVVLAIFLLHKLPGIYAGPESGRWNSLLTTIGYLLRRTQARRRGPGGRPTGVTPRPTWLR